MAVIRSSQRRLVCSSEPEMRINAPSAAIAEGREESERIRGGGNELDVRVFLVTEEPNYVVSAISCQEVRRLFLC